MQTVRELKLSVPQEFSLLQNTVDSRSLLGVSIRKLYTISGIHQVSKSSSDGHIRVALSIHILKANLLQRSTAK